ncbi:histidinol-phosphate transaminase [Bacillus sp. T33-2]|uniref:histidinol-phosphate transaminase n=1 Tax=Bacillus sp. T33-2 TaxID=2054168 RepID=UPI000C782314|nr:histidinol-phosphate transaminase [Bacillus sp. T33-2]PLR99741.1 histidinol-phosphate transaminase [Bacillus sp. T33-2]
MKWKEQILSLNPYQPGKTIGEVKRQYGLDEIVKLASNENPFGCSVRVGDAVQQLAGTSALYPDGYATGLREALAAHLGVNEEQLIFGNGSDELIMMISRGLLVPGTNTVMAAPTFPQYKHNAVIEGSEAREVPLLDGAHDLEGMLQAIDANTRVVWLCSPNNPTGEYIGETELLAFLSRVPADVLVVLDEAYHEYVVAEDYYDAIELANRFENLIVLRTFSKIYGLAGFRVGYGIGNKQTIRALEPVREPFNVNSYGLAAARAALSDQEFVQKCSTANREGLQQFYDFCNENHLAYYPSQGNFILIDFGADGQEIFQYLLERGYIVRSGKALGFPSCVRITIGSKEQNAGVIKQLKQMLETRSTVSGQNG